MALTILIISCDLRLPEREKHPLVREWAQTRNSSIMQSTGMMFELNGLVSVHIIPVLDNVEWKKTARRNCDRVDNRVEESGCGTRVRGGGAGGDKGGTPLFHSTLNYFDGN